MRFDPFVIPFCLGLACLTAVLAMRFVRWISELESGASLKILRMLPSRQSAEAIHEIFMECLLHRKVFRVNKLLGYMHMSLAFGWFLLIVTGKLEASFYTGEFANEIYFPVFIRFFETHPPLSESLRWLNGLMDLLLLFILTGLCLAVFKRFRSASLGIRRSTRHSTADRVTLSFLWLIFPLRLLAESFTAGIYANGSFLTQPLGNLLNAILPAEQLAYPAWWAYSAVLGGFLALLPFSRYMHIPAEVLLILLRKWGFKAEPEIAGVAAVALNACSRCGICLDPCQMNNLSTPLNSQMVYFLRDLRHRKSSAGQAHECLMCGRCQEICPVGIDLTGLRMTARKTDSGTRLETGTYPGVLHPENHPEILYFAGCMGSLTPAISVAMEKILEESGKSYTFLDKYQDLCCGRPSKLSGRLEDARRIAHNLETLINSLNASILVTSCPICYKCFKKDYNCNLQIYHHSEYILQLMASKTIRIRHSNIRFAYHDPCELGRKSGIYDQPREILERMGYLVSGKEKEPLSLCCGGSLGNFALQQEERNLLQKNTSVHLNSSHPDLIATACPVCKKSLARFSERPVRDLAEIVAENLIKSHTKGKAVKYANLTALAEI